jgi:hypothetical protein
MILKESADQIVLIGSMKVSRAFAAMLSLILVGLAWALNLPYLLFGLTMLIPLMFLGDTGRCIITRKDKRILFVQRETFRLKPVVKSYPFSNIQAISIVRAPAGNENEGYGIGFKINSEWKNAINNFTLSETKAKQIINLINERIKDV